LDEWPIDYLKAKCHTLRLS